MKDKENVHVDNDAATPTIVKKPRRHFVIDDSDSEAGTEAETTPQRPQEKLVQVDWAITPMKALFERTAREASRSLALDIKIEAEKWAPQRRPNYIGIGMALAKTRSTGREMNGTMAEFVEHSFGAIKDNPILLNQDDFNLHLDGLLSALESGRLLLSGLTCNPEAKALDTTRPGRGTMERLDQILQHGFHANPRLPLESNSRAKRNCLTSTSAIFFYVQGRNAEEVMMAVDQAVFLTHRVLMMRRRDQKFALGMIGGDTHTRIQAARKWAVARFPAGL
jgi:hypothetical protein